MNIPKLSKKPITKSCHNITWEDDYAWIHQDNILDVLKDGQKLLPEVKKELRFFIKKVNGEDSQIN